MDSLLPIFPLPDVVLFPNVFLPLHVFEPRYREMVADAMAADRLIGMVLLRPGWERDYEGRPAVYPVGCLGVMTHIEPIAGGRYNIMLRGIERFRIAHEDHERSYRRAAMERLAEHPLADEDRAAVARHRARLELLLEPAGERRPGRSRTADVKIPSEMPDADLVNALAQHLDLEPVEKQALLERPTLRDRAESLVELLEMKAVASRTPGASTRAH
jgi:Lon protease-like protein